MEISSEDARDLAFDIYEGSLYKQVHNKFAGEWRWGNTYELVIEDVAGNFWRTYWQDSSGDGDWRTFDDEDVIEFERVVPREKVVIEYVRAGSN